MANKWYITNTYESYIDLFLKGQGFHYVIIFPREQKNLINYLKKEVINRCFTDPNYYLYCLMYAINAKPQDMNTHVLEFLERNMTKYNIPSALFIVGECYYLGIVVKQDEYKAFEYFKKASEMDHPKATYYLSHMYRQGRIVPRNMDIAYPLMEKAGHLGSGDAILIFAMTAFQNGHYQAGMSNLKTASSYGSLEAQIQLVKRYIEDRNVQNINEGIKLLMQYADKGNAFCQSYLGTTYLKGKHLLLDEQEGLKWLKLAAMQELGEAYHNIGVYYYTKKMFIESKINMEKAIELKCDESYPYLAYLYDAGLGTKEDVHKALHYYRLAAENGSIVAMHNMGAIYYNGKDDVAVDYNEAFKWYKTAADRGSLQALIRMSLMYQEGKGVPQSIEMGIKLMLEAANKGSVDAQNYMADYYAEGHGVPRNEEESIKWSMKSANQGDLMGICNVGFFYMRQRNYIEAEKWLLEAANQGEPVALYNLGCLYNPDLPHDGIIPDGNKSFEYWKKSAELGYYYAQNNIGLMYERGIYVDQNYQEALKWFELSAAQGNPIARSNIARVKSLIVAQEEQEFADIIHDNDVFISWNHHNKETKDAITKYLREHNIKVWESDSSGSGEVSKQCKLGIKYSSVYLVLLSKESIKSEWVKKEIDLILEKEKESPSISELIRPIYIDDVSNEISLLEEGNPFKIISRLSSNFGVKEDEILSIVKEMLSKHCLEQYNASLFNNAQEFNLFMSEDLKDDEKGSIISTLVKYSEGYIERKLIDINGKEYQDYEVIGKERIFSIIAPGGTGKSLFLKNIIRKYNVLNKGNKTLMYDYFFLFSFSEIVKYYKENKGNIEQYIFEYLKKQEEDNDRRLEKLYLQDKKVMILIDALDEAGGDKEILKEISKALREYIERHQGNQIIITTRNMQNGDEYLNSIPQYSLSKLNDEDIHIIIERLFNEFKVKVFDKEKYSPDINSFYKSLEEEIYEDIKTNPLLLVNLAIIYFLKRKLPRSEYEIIDQASKIIINDVENKVEIGINCQDLMKITNELLGYISFARYIGSKESSKELIRDYLEYKGVKISNVEEQIEDYVYYLKVRSILVNDNLYHNMFRSYFSAKYLFELLYMKKSIPIKYYEFVDKGREILEQYNKEYFKDISPWIEIVSSLLTRLDYSIYNLLGREIDANNSNYQVINETIRILHLPMDQRVNLYEYVTKLCRNRAFYNYLLISNILIGLKDFESNNINRFKFKIKNDF